MTFGFDLNDDGFGDAAVSANDEGGVFVFFGRSTGLAPVALRVARTQSMFDLFGASLYPSWRVVRSSMLERLDVC